MDTSFAYPQLFDMDVSFDNKLFNGLTLQDPSSPNDNNLFNALTLQDSPHHNELYNDKSAHYDLSMNDPNNNNNTNPNYLHYFQTDLDQSEFVYDPSFDPHMLMAPPQMELADYDYFQRQELDQKQHYNWLYDPLDTILPQPSQHNDSLFCDDNMMINFATQDVQPFDYLMSDTPLADTVVEGGMSRDYVSLSDVNSFVAKNDSEKDACLIQSTSDFNLAKRDFLSSSESTNEDSEDEYSDHTSDWPYPTTDDRLMIKIKKSPDQLPPWELISPKLTKSASCRTVSKCRKSLQYPKKKPAKVVRRGSAPNRLTADNSSLNMADFFDEEEDDDDEFQIKPSHMNRFPSKKGRNVDKACNHCKRSHLRCDDMRPCRRCVATGKIGCKDVQHKPRGRPKLHKK